VSDSSQAEPADEETRLSRGEIGRRASAGLFFIASTGVILLVIGFFGNLVLARLLTPADFGIIALGLVMITLASTVADGGLAAALIRRETPPTHKELRSLTGLQLVFTLAIAIVLVAVALNFGEAGAIAAVMIMTIPLSSFQVGGRVTILRNLEFWRTSVADVASTVAFYTWSITAAALGAGAWSMATGTVVRTIVATIAIVSLSPAGLLLPARPHVRRLMPEIRFGVRFQLAWIVGVVGEALTNAATALIAGVSVLGQWTLVSRLMQLPLLLFQSVWQVSYPAMAHLLADDEDPRPMLEEATRIATVAGVFVLVPFAAAVPVLITPVFGAKWNEAGVVLPLACLGLLLFGPISASATGYLNATNRPGDMVRVKSYSNGIVVLLVVALLPVFGLVAIGIAAIVNGVLEALWLDRYVRRACGARLLSRTLLPLTIGVISGAVAVGFSHTVPDTVPWAFATGTLAVILLASGLAIACRSDLRSTFAIGRMSVLNVLGRRRRGRSSVGVTL